MRLSDQNLIRGFPIFRGVSDSVFEMVAAQATIRDHTPPAQLLREGERPEFLFVLLNGLVETFTERDGIFTTLAFVRPPAAFIAAAVWLDQVQLTSARVLAPSRVLAIPAAAVRAGMATDPAFCIALGSELATRYRDVMKELKNQRKRSAAERLANWLLMEAKVAGSNDFGIQVPRTVLASRLAMTPEHLSRAFASLQPHGVTVAGKVITIDPTLLAQFARPDPLIDQSDV